MKYLDTAEFAAANMFGQGQPNDAYAEYFTGKSYLNVLNQPTEQVELAFSNVTFEPGCRNHWHRHYASSGGGQILICTAGEGWYQAEGELPVSLREGSLVVVPPNVKHWQGAKADSWFSHVVLLVPGQDCQTVWLEPVDQQHYSQLEQ